MLIFSNFHLFFVKNFIKFKILIRSFFQINRLIMKKMSKSKENENAIYQI